MAASQLDEAREVFSGAGGSWFLARAQLTESLWAKLTGDAEWSALEFEAPPPDLGQSPPSAMVEPSRQLDEAFEDLVDGFPEDWGHMMGPTVWVLSQGNLIKVSGDEVRSRLQSMADDFPPLSVSDPRIYDSRELRGQWPSPLPALLEALCDSQRALLRSATYADDERSYGRCANLFTLKDGRPEIHAALVPGFDDSLIGHAGRSTDEHEGARIADRVVRAFLLGQASTVMAQQNRIMERMIFNGDPLDFEVFVSRAHRRRRLDTLRIVFGRTERLPKDDSLLQLVQKQSKKIWLRKSDVFTPTGFRIQLAFMDASGRLETMNDARVVALKVWQRDGTGEDVERWRLGALEVPPLPQV